MTFTLGEDSALLQPVTIGDTVAANRIFMAPLTRSRADADGPRRDTPESTYPPIFHELTEDRTRSVPRRA